MTTTTITTDATRFARQEALLRDEIAALNAVLGLDGRNAISFGYIGNVAPDGVSRDSRSWYVFLPHPGRVGTTDDSLGGFATGSLEGVVAARRDLRVFAKGVAFARSL